MTPKDSIEEINELLERWDQEFRTSSDWSGYYARLAEPESTVNNIIALLQRMAEIVEFETELWYKKDPDPFDERHPGRSDPNSALGNVLKAIYKNDNFMTNTVNNYMCGRGDSASINLLHTIAARLLLDIMPGLETTVVFLNNEALVRNLFDWSQTDNEPLASYSVGLLAEAMECADIAATFKDNNYILVPFMIKKLITLKEKSDIERPFKDIGKDLRTIVRNASTPMLNKRKLSQDDEEESMVFTDDLATNISTNTTTRQCSKRQKIHLLSPDLFNPNWLENLNTTNSVEGRGVLESAGDVAKKLTHLPETTAVDIKNANQESQVGVGISGSNHNLNSDRITLVKCQDEAIQECEDGTICNADNGSIENTEEIILNEETKVLNDKNENFKVGISRAMGNNENTGNQICGENNLEVLERNVIANCAAIAGNLVDVENDDRGHHNDAITDDEDEVEIEKIIDTSTKDVQFGSIAIRNLRASNSWMSPNRQITQVNEHSGSRWSELEQLVIGTYQMWPLSIQMQQRFILTYLQQIGEYQELLCHVFEQPVLNLIFYYIDLKRNKDVRLAFEALRYLAALLCHKRFATEFIAVGGVQKFLDIHRPSVAATGVSMCLYYLAYFEDAMERVCLLPSNVLKELVSYGLWLLECSHESGRVHATMFFGLSFSFRIIVDLFDQQDGLRKLFNVMSTLQIFNIDDHIPDLSEDDLLVNKRSARHVTVAIRRYMESHLGYKADHIRRTQVRQDGGMPPVELQANKAAKCSPEVIQSNIELLLEQLPARSNWKPVTDLIKLGAIQTLVQLLVTAQDWSNYAGKVETMKSGLDIVSICCVIPRAQLMLCHDVKVFGSNGSIPAISALLILCSSNVNLDVEVQKAALNVIINCVCGPISKVGGLAPRSLTASVKRKSGLILADEQVVDMWQAVRTNNGIMALLNLLTIKYPVTEADGVRALACKALVGLSRCDTVKQIISKLPMFCNSQIQQLLWEPVLPDKRTEHSRFCKYALQLIEQVSGKHPPPSTDASLDRMRRADIVSQTPITFHKKELLQLMMEHLLKEGLTKTAAILATEAELPLLLTNQLNNMLTNNHSSIQPSNQLPARLLNDVLAHQLASNSTNQLSNQLSAQLSNQMSVDSYSPVKIRVPMTPKSINTLPQSALLDCASLRLPNSVVLTDRFHEVSECKSHDQLECNSIISNKVILKKKKVPTATLR